MFFSLHLLQILYWGSTSGPFVGRYGLFYANVKELNTEASLLELERPFSCPAGACKCCCYQSAKVTSGGQEIGSIKEKCYFWYVHIVAFGNHTISLYYMHANFSSAFTNALSFTVNNQIFSIPEFEVYDHGGKGLYRLHQPTCCGGCCVNCCAEGNPCFGRGCCKVPFHLFPYDQSNTNNAEEIGKIVKKPKSMMTEVFTDSDAFVCISYYEFACV